MTIVDIGCINQSNNEITSCIYNNMSLAALNQL